jgi:tetratricopeptide (TPR) repeat protein
MTILIRSAKITQTAQLLTKPLKFICLALLLLVFFTVAGQRAAAQQGTQTLFGDVKIDETKAGEGPPPKIMAILYKDAGGEIGRQPISNRSRYRFQNLVKGEYQLAIEVDSNEIARIRIVIGELSTTPYGFQQDLEFALRPRGGAKPGIVSADAYNRSSSNKSLYEKAQDAADKKKYDQAITLLRQIVDNDKMDFQAWTLLGTIYRVQEKPDDAEKAYLSALEAKPTFVLALVDLGRLRSSQKKYDAAIDPLTRAVEAQPQSAEANFLLGEAYIQIKKGSKAIGYLNEAARLGRPEAHLRLGWLYNAAGMKDKAAIEYEEFLKKKPEYADRKKLEEYIAANKKR